jgi:hypothetical protein
MGLKERKPMIQAKTNGHMGHFNEKAKVTENSANGNFSEKDASIAYLTERGKKGITVREYKQNKMTDKYSTGNNGVTAYNSKPINQVYKPATGGSVPSKYPKGKDC